MMVPKARIRTLSFCPILYHRHQFYRLLQNSWRIPLPFAFLTKFRWNFFEISRITEPLNLKFKPPTKCFTLGSSLFRNRFISWNIAAIKHLLEFFKENCFILTTCFLNEKIHKCLWKKDLKFNKHVLDQRGEGTQ
jgi:hypothetical protein